MKCRSVACVWSGPHLPHRVTATAVLHRPSTLYTGGDDGSVIWWNLSGENSDPEIKSIAMLCGHAAPIVGLGICYPVAVSRNGNMDNFTYLKANYMPPDHGALISVCIDGVLCVWSRGSGHCRRRRKLPPWVGSPSIVQTMPSNPRYICIACCFIDAVHLFGHQSMDPLEGPDSVGKKEPQHRKPSKSTLVIVDSYTLSIVRTFFHGQLSIGPLKFMSVVTAVEDREKQLAIMIDSSGNSQVFPILKYYNVNGESGADSHKSYSHSNSSIRADGFSEWGDVVSVATCGPILAFVFKTRCLFRLGVSGDRIGDIQFSDDHVILEDASRRVDIIGGTFLERHGGASCSLDNKIFAVWDDRGFAIAYSVSYMDGFFKSEFLYVIPAARWPHDARLSFSFVMLNSLLLRVESVCFRFKEPFLWKPHVTIWLPNLRVDDSLKPWQQCKLLGEGGFLADPMHGNGVQTINASIDSASRQNCIQKVDIASNIWANNEYRGSVQAKTVSSSMVISENFGIPYAVVYGFYSGEIELIQFDILLARHNSCNGSPRVNEESNVSKRIFSGHVGAVLCLAAHQMLGICKGSSSSAVLLSGSMDCTVRIWDLDSGNLITIMHQHVAPVRQIILPPSKTERPWNDCFLTVGEDFCVSLASLETLRVERVFPGHPNYPSKVVWDGARGYVACISKSSLGTSEEVDVLYIWDIKTGARERVLRGTAAHSMFDHFYKSINMSSTIGNFLNANTSASSLFLPVSEDTGLNNADKGLAQLSKLSVLQSNHWPSPIKCSCPFPGIATLSFDLSSLMLFFHMLETVNSGHKPENSPRKEQSTDISSPRGKAIDHGSNLEGISIDDMKESESVKSLEGCLLCFCLSVLHFWSVDHELDKLLVTNLRLKKTDEFLVSSGLQGDRGSLTVTFPGLEVGLELWKSSSEFCAMRSLTMVSLAQRMISFSQISSSASSALAAFYTRNLADKIPDIMPPSLQLLVSFWQDESEHVRMAGRSLFHCAASRAIPLPLCSPRASKHAKNFTLANGMREDGNKIKFNEEKSQNFDYDGVIGSEGASGESDIHSWLEAYEDQDWLSCVGGTSQDAMTSHIIVAAALAIWYPTIVKPSLPTMTVHPLIKLVMAMNEKYSCTAAELLAEGMESTWKVGIGSEIPHLIGDIFFQVECVSGASNNFGSQNPFSSASIRDTLVGVLLPSLAMTDILGFLSVIESQIWSTASDSPVHLVSLITLARVARVSPKSLAPFLDKVLNFILRTMDPNNSVMRRTCLQSAMAALREIVRIFPMVALNKKSTRLAVGDAVGEIKNASIWVYDMQSVSKVKVLDASGPPGLPSLLVGVAEAVMTTVISALSFSPDGEGIVAFSEQGLLIRWWSLGSVWWDKFSRNLLPVQCTKLIFVPPWEGFSPNSSRSSIMESITRCDGQGDLKGTRTDCTDLDDLKVVIQNLDLSYHLEWLGDRKVVLKRHGLDLGTFLL